MTVQDLINKLLDYPSNMRVLTLGYEGGFDEIVLTTEDIIFDSVPKDKWYYGTHDSAELLGASNGTTCLIFSRTK